MDFMARESVLRTALSAFIAPLFGLRDQAVGQMDCSKCSLLQDVQKQQH
jgi:hypothetical protein